MKPDLSRPGNHRTRGAAPGDAKKKKQLALVAFLLAVLLIALAINPSDESPSVDPAVSAKTSLVSLKPRSERATDPENEVLLQRFVTTEQLPSLTQEEITTIDLFQRAAVEVVEADPAQAPPRTKAKPTVEYTLGAVYGAYNGTDRKALIDGQIVETGEELESGVMVLAVSPEGVQIAP